MAEFTFKEKTSFYAEHERQEYLDLTEKAIFFKKVGGEVFMIHVGGYTRTIDMSGLEHEHRWAEIYQLKSYGS